MIEFITGAALGFFGSLFVLPIILGLLRAFGLYTVVHEGYCHVYVLFGNVIGILKEPGFYFLPIQLGPAAFIVNWLGQRHVVDMRLDQRYLRSQPVNSEEGAPMGIGVWYEMRVNDPMSYLFKNADPQGSLAANVSNAVVRTLSNMPLADMLEERHGMSRAVRDEVSPKSREWGYDLGSVYIRKVHFRDFEMIRQIEAKVVNRLRQVTSAIKQDGVNQVSIITSTAERQAAIEFAKAEALRPRIVGEALHEINRDPEVAEALFTILEYQRLLDGDASITLMPSGSPVLSKLLAAGNLPEPQPVVRRG
ncbi:MAG TPA: SPFH domain-containing protein [Roseiflexaceae bacterium]|nr:SPFH domain-containing protein [Roseiflexaceae bacterium]HMP42931.1 SPFH domain-containing protein [Roseiflexaceae bacterium]